MSASWRQMYYEEHRQLEAAHDFIAAHATFLMERGECTQNDLRRGLGLRPRAPDGFVVPLPRPPERRRWWWYFQGCKSVASWGVKCEWSRGHVGPHGRGMEHWSNHE